jgi:hypothetical protein
MMIESVMTNVPTCMLHGTRASVCMMIESVMTNLPHSLVELRVKRPAPTLKRPAEVLNPNASQTRKLVLQAVLQALAQYCDIYK